MKFYIIPPCHFNIERLEREVNILLISDLHYDVSVAPCADFPSGPEINAKLVKSLPPRLSDWEPDIVIVAGDLVNATNKKKNRKAGTGGKDSAEKNYKHYIDLVNELTAAYPNLRPCVFSTPGNHDVNRPAERSIEKKKVTQIIANLSDGIPLPGQVRRPKVKNLYVAAKRDYIRDEKLLELLAELEQVYFKTYLDQQSAMISTGILKKPLINTPFKGINTVYNANVLGVNIISHNSSFFCNLSKYKGEKYNDDRDHLFLVVDLVKGVSGPLPVGPVVSFMHHPYYFLNEGDYISPVPMEGDANDRLNIFSEVLKASDLVLSGHVHGELQEPTNQQQHAYLITNGTSYTPNLWSTKCYPYTYGLIKVNKQRNWFAMEKRVYNHGKGTYIPTPGEPLMHYEFSYRPDSTPTNLESEKLGVIDHFYYWDKTPEPEKSYRYYIYQLSLYDDQFRHIPDKGQQFGFEKIMIGKQDGLLVSAGKSAQTILIIEINAEQPDVEIMKVLQHPVLKKVHHDKHIFFSVYSKTLMETNNQTIIGKIGKLWRDYRYYILLNKIENVNINLLYHH